jgi:ATP-dependent DNA helicase PIF1
MELSDDQKEVLIHYCRGENVFITGAGGSGKTELIRHIYKMSLRTRKNIQVCALTGCAAILLNCNGTTIHSWSGVGTNMEGSINDIARKCLQKKMNKKKWVSTDVLIIDEVSMLSKKLFEILNLIGKLARENIKPFGGIQLIFSGDFYQLPPIGNDEYTRAFCFESEYWSKVFINQIELKTIFRQKDSNYVKILNQVRRGRISKNSFNILMSCVEKKVDDLEIKPTKLYPLKKIVERLNKSELNVLPGEPINFSVTINVIGERSRKYSRNDPKVKKEVNVFLNQIPCAESIELKIGAQVMSVANIDLESCLPICNGSCGIITGFEYGGDSLPIVRFKNGLETAMKPFTWESSGDSDISISITQIPLILAWSITIHKSQGATLDMAEIDIGSGIFEEGQTYVALSRVKSLDGLYIKTMDPWGIKANNKVREYYSRF